MVPEFKPIDWIMIGVFNYVFHIAIMSWLHGVWTGALVGYFGWLMWRRYENWRMVN